ncbi:hypothetical protein RchiOBHm_Chr2g0142361 [Rosa chinensis]|uniref:Uncharacterized protein n=1 Tax=Rosa chinensis TaxID=74649 RepID=A0A2P6RXV4_ROSCH|nr:hypothetical protein RchiOBHm_Chr2g0142361 [Rosa chinensis]
METHLLLRFGRVLRLRRPLRASFLARLHSQANNQRIFWLLASHSSVHHFPGPGSELGLVAVDFRRYNLTS